MGDFIELGKVYTHSRNGNDYIVTKYEPGKYLTKDPDSGRWHDAVEFQSRTGEAEGKTFVRQADDFRNKFVSANQDA